MGMKLNCAGKLLDLSEPQVMGILNVTPDSFSDGGRLYSGEAVDVSLVEKAALSMVDAGASVLDVGGESTRPGAELVGLQQEMDRVLPVVERLSSLSIVLSVDTSSPKLMSEAAKLGAGMVNDVRALSRDGAVGAVAGTEMAVCLMHMQGAPKTMQNAPSYSNVIDEVAAYLDSRVRECEETGIAKNRICIDPGFGFGKTLQNNLSLLANLEKFHKLDLPVLVGMSRKSMIGGVLENDVSERLPASLALATMAAMKGAQIIRVHDVKETVDAVRMTQAVMQEIMI